MHPEKCSSYVSSCNSATSSQLRTGVLAVGDMPVAASHEEQVKLAFVTLQLLTWLGLAPNQIVMAVLVVVMVSSSLSGRL